mmetsp:Transcript_4734/g.12443  ORF Transcript_4734/g.12443 Transcript_4734/m.12443 type:complete len:317 (+) Transcript_4734:16-966(+)
MKWYGQKNAKRCKEIKKIDEMGRTVDYFINQSNHQSINPSLLAALRGRRVLGRTVIIVTSDNGGVCKLKKADLATEPERCPLLAGAHAQNGNLRGYKGTPWEGGLRVPLLIRWGGSDGYAFVTPPGFRSSQAVLLADLVRTLALLGGVRLREGDARDSMDLRQDAQVARAASFSLLSLLSLRAALLLPRVLPSALVRAGAIGGAAGRVVGALRLAVQVGGYDWAAGRVPQDALGGGTRRGGGHGARVPGVGEHTCSARPLRRPVGDAGPLGQTGGEGGERGSPPDGQRQRPLPGVLADSRRPRLCLLGLCRHEAAG